MTRSVTPAQEATVFSGEKPGDKEHLFDVRRWIRFAPQSRYAATRAEVKSRLDNFPTLCKSESDRLLAQIEQARQECEHAQG